jgi:hypothetical protein
MKSMPELPSNIDSPYPSPRLRLAMAAVGLLLAANVVVPLVWGDVYPFTSAPMFRDAPTCCCNYRVYALDGRELPAENWLVQRLYDGNPLGYGVGICPPEILESEFGRECDEAAVLAHIQRQFSRPENREFAAVEVVQEVIGPVDSQHVGAVRTGRWRVERP